MIAAGQPSRIRKSSMAVISNIEIKIDGKPMKDFDFVLIEQNLYDIDNFEITCRYDTIEKPDEFLIRYSREYLGAPAIIQAGTRSGKSEKDVLFMKGFVTDIQGTRTGMADNDKIVISGGSEEISLNGKPTNRAFTDKTLEEIVKEVIKPYPVTGSIKTSDKFRYPYIVQFEESDLEFLKRLSVRYGEWFFFNDGKMFFGELPDPAREEKLTIGNDLLDFSYNLRVSPVKFSLISNDPVKSDIYRYNSGGKADQGLTEYGKFALEKSKKIYPSGGMHYYKYLNVDENDFQKAIDKAGERDEESDASNLSVLSGSSINPFLTAGMHIKVDCSGQNMTSPPINYGVYLVTSVQHSFDNLFTYKNVFNAAPDKIKIPGNTNPYFIKTSPGQIGTVADNQDPKKLGRIRVHFPWMDNSSLMTPWIPITTPYAHENSGIYFVPSVSSRVMVGFEGDDVEKPYCIGAVFDQAKAPDSAWAGDYNNKDSKVHAIRSLSGQTIELHDEPGKEKIRIYDTKNKNEIILDTANGSMTIKAADKLVIEAKEIEIKAQSGMKIEAGQTLYQKGMEIKSEAQTNLEAKAASVEIKSDGALKASGSASAEISSSGVMTVKGSIVMIN